jgi:hypothetical protein
VQSYEKKIIQTNNLSKNEIIQTNNLPKNEIIQTNNPKKRAFSNLRTFEVWATFPY